jgi:predicted DNA-binding transcriptional regulator YafY
MGQTCRHGSRYIDVNILSCFKQKTHHINGPNRANILRNGINDTLAYRLAEILTKLNLGESLDPQALADEFKVTLRTIQRDLNVRFGCLPLIKSGGRYRLQDTKLGKLTIKDLEQFASLSGVAGLFPKLSERFLRGVFDSGQNSAWIVKGHNYEDLSGKETLFSDIERAINEHRHVEFNYTNSKNEFKFYAGLEPYKLLNQKGIWYLAACAHDTLKSFSVSRIEALQVETTTFVPRPAVEAELSRSESLWHGATRQRVVLRVSGKVADYFKRRKLLPHQEIEGQLVGGDLLVATTVVHADEVLPVVRYWIPHIRILEPVEMQQHLEGGLTDYLCPPLATK